MSINKFMELDDQDELKVTKKDYKNKVDKELKTKFEDSTNLEMNLLNLVKKNEPDKKKPMSIYFKEEDLKLLKAISKVNNTTVNKTIMSILEIPLNATKNNLPSDFNIEKLAKEYDKKSRNKNSVNK